jgi:hypothetical protein
MKFTDRIRRLKAVLGLFALAVVCQACQFVQNEFWAY